MENEAATSYVSKFIGKNLRVHTNDSRIFAGQLRCTDKDCNVILSLTHEYRPPSAASIRKAIVESGRTSAPVPMTSRFVGLVVVPGQYITKIEYEESIFSREKIMT